MTKFLGNTKNNIKNGHFLKTRFNEIIWTKSDG